MMRIELLGTSFQIQSDESPEYVERILSYYRDRVSDIETSVATGDPLKKAILAALLVTDELFRERASQTPGDATIPADHAREIERITTSLIERIDSSLEE
jgi:cell division protein ZapA